MATWDVFHSDRLELERGLDTARVIEALARGDLVVDDLIRPAGGDAAWTRIGDRPALLEAAAVARPAPAPVPDAPPEEHAPPVATAGGWIEGFPPEPPDDDADTAAESTPEPLTSPVPEPLTSPAPEPFGAFDLDLRAPGSDARRRAEGTSVEIAAVGEADLVADEEEDEAYDPLEEDEAAAEFTLSRNRPETVEELDLAAMVDVAFQLVLFFLVTATTVLYKTLEVPRPGPDSSPAAAAQGRPKSLEELSDDFIVVEVDPAGAIKVDREPVAADLGTLVARLREARERTNRQGLLLSADFATPHRNAVLVYDAANEARLSIAIARPSRADAP